MTEREMKRKAAARKARERKARTRRVALTVALMLVVCVVSVGGTIAWLQDKTEVVTNTFSPTNIDLTLEETSSNEFDIVPGTTDAKDPKVTIENDVSAYLFVEVDESWTATFGTGSDVRTYTLSNFVNYTLTLNGENSGWTRGGGDGEGKDGVPTNVWYRVVGANDATKSWYLLTGSTVNEHGQVTYGTGITKQMMDDLESLTGDSPDYPKLSFKAYAIQKDNITQAATGTDTEAKTAWKLASSTTSTN